MSRPINNHKKKKKKKRKKKEFVKIEDFAVPTDHRAKLKESEKKDKYLEGIYTRELKITMEHESDGYTNCLWC